MSVEPSWWGKGGGGGRVQADLHTWLHALAALVAPERRGGAGATSVFSELLRLETKV